MMTMKVEGTWKKTDSFLQRVSEIFKMGILDKYGKQGVNALSANTPRDTGLLASSWYYKIERGNGYFAIVFCNSDIENGQNVAVIVRYGHATKRGGWVEGRDFITPAIQPVFDEMAYDLWKEVKGS